MEGVPQVSVRIDVDCPGPPKAKPPPEWQLRLASALGGAATQELLRRHERLEALRADLSKAEGKAVELQRAWGKAVEDGGDGLAQIEKKLAAAEADTSALKKRLSTLGEAVRQQLRLALPETQLKLGALYQELAGECQAAVSSSKRDFLTALEATLPDVLAAEEGLRLPGDWLRGLQHALRGGEVDNVVGAIKTHLGGT
jgi:hypothetical protein